MNFFDDFSFEHQVESLTEELLFITETNSDEEGLENSKETIRTYSNLWSRRNNGKWSLGPRMWILLFCMYTRRKDIESSWKSIKF